MGRRSSSAIARVPRTRVLSCGLIGACSRRGACARSGPQPGLERKEPHSRQPVSFHPLRQAGRPEWAEVERLGKSVLVAAAKGDDREAAAAFMSYWLGRWRWSPERFKSAIAATIPKIALGIIANAPTTLKVCAEVTAPVLLIKRSKTPRSREARPRARRRCGRYSGRDTSKCQGRDAKRGRAYESVHPSGGAQSPDLRSSREPAVTRSGSGRTGAPSSSGSSAASRANSSSSSLA